VVGLFTGLLPSVPPISALQLVWSLHVTSGVFRLRIWLSFVIGVVR
jgi:hypothetical protein